MKLLLNGVPQLEALLSPQKAQPGCYRPSVYNYIYQQDQIIYLFNTLSRRLAQITPEEEAVLRSQQVEEITPQLEALVAQRFLVKDGTDEAAHYMQIYSLLDIWAKREDKGFSVYEILTTTGCNARCFYCYEAGTKVSHMSTETADAVAAFIRKTRHPEKQLRLDWFGGEPLLNPSVIDSICRQLTQDGISFRSTLVTNGLLWNEALAQKAKEEWLLDRVQITLDGFGQEHNRRKAYLGFKEDPFEKTIENIAMLLDVGIRVMVRLNMDLNNIESIYQVYNYLKDRFAGYSGLLLDPSLLEEKWFQWDAKRSAEQQANLRQQWKALREQAESDVLLRAKPLKSKLRRHHCMANSPSSVTILPDGTLSLCQTGNPEMYYGDIWQGVTKPELLTKWQDNSHLRPACRDCVWLPECTAFSLCPAKASDCAQKQEDNFLQRLRVTLKNLSNS
jgi:radical SAM protein with 4Fe4S-binding SPASM domain